MGNKTLVYRQKVENNMKESLNHLKRLNDAFDQLGNSYSIPFDKKGYQAILANLQDLAFSD
jgi:deoxyxylulose-5-phosphate synthase